MTLVFTLFALETHEHLLIAIIAGCHHLEGFCEAMSNHVTHSTTNSRCSWRLWHLKTCPLNKSVKVSRNFPKKFIKFTFLFKNLNSSFNFKMESLRVLFHFFFLPVPLKLLSSLSALEYGGDFIGLLVFGTKLSFIMSVPLQDPGSVGKRVLLPA